MWWASQFGSSKGSQLTRLVPSDLEPGSKMEIVEHVRDPQETLRIPKGLSELSVGKFLGSSSVWCGPWKS